MSTEAPAPSAEEDREPDRLLVVDDNPDNLDMLSRRLERRGYQVTTSDGGKDALAKLDHERFDLVILDIMMPDVDGLEVLKQVREKQDAGRLPIIMATAKDESSDVVNALKLGANDYVTKPIDFPVLIARVNTQLGLKHATEERDQAYVRMKQDLDAAALVQKALLPSSMPEVPGARFAWKYQPCDELAGDILNVFAFDENRLGLYVLDVSGHGVEAALYSSALCHVLASDGGVVRGRDREPTPPLELAKQLNERFQMDPATLQYFTMLYGILDLSDRSFNYVCAGHPAPVLLRPAQGAALQEGRGSPVGLIEECLCYAYRIQLEAGDRLYLYCDGVIEAMNEEREQFAEENLLACLESMRNATLDESLDHCIATVNSWTNNTHQDDVSFLAVELS